MSDQMHITEIFLDGGKPVRITVSLPVGEAARIVEVFGELGGEESEIDVYGCLTGELFNRFWINGVQGYRGDDE